MKPVSNDYDEKWNDWKWQIQNSITTYEQLKKYNISFDEDIENLNLPIRTTPYFLSICHNNKKLLKTIIPSIDETIISEGESEDPLGEEGDRKNECIIHRYPDRVLFLSTNFCSSNCRYCTRSRIINNNQSNTKKWQIGIDYIKCHPEVRDVLISGGDFLTLPDDKIEYLLSEIKKIEHVEIIRIGTKIPVVLPMRITDELVNILKKYHPLFMSIHFTHANEITNDVKIACEKLANAGIPLGSQTVLLKDVNNTVEEMSTLMKKLLQIRVKPYYLYTCDQINGSKHFRCKIEEGLNIIIGMRGFISGYAIPTFVIDLPEGGGKFPLLPDKYNKNGNKYCFKNYNNKNIEFFDF